MLENITIRNFRLFKEFSIDRLAPVNLIVGKNNVGKSSLLEALYLLVNQKVPGVLLSLLEARGEIAFLPDEGRGYDLAHLFFGHHWENLATILIRSGPTRPLELKVTLHRNVEQFTFSHFGEFNNEASENRLDHDFLRVEYSDRQFVLDVYGDVITNRHAAIYKRTEMAHSNVNYITTKGVEYNALARLWDSITLTPKEDDVIEMLKILEADVERISFQSRQTSNSGILIRYKGQDYPVPLGSMGDGMHRIMAIATALANSEDGYLFVDEIDTGLHYRTITDMWNLVFKTAQRLNIQVFATTHSLDCIKSFTEALHLQDDQTAGNLFRLERRHDQIIAVDYETQDLTTAMQEGIEVR